MKSINGRSPVDWDSFQPAEGTASSDAANVYVGSSNLKSKSWMIFAKYKGLLKNPTYMEDSGKFYVWTVFLIFLFIYLIKR